MKGWKPALDEDGIPTEYHDKLNRYFALHEPESFEDIECAILEVVQDLAYSKPKEHVKPWMNSEIQDLIRKRSNTRNQEERKMLSIKLKKVWRREKRKYQNKSFDQILNDFKKFENFDRVRDAPIKRRMPKSKPNEEDVHRSWSNIFLSEMGRMTCNDINFEALADVDS